MSAHTEFESVNLLLDQLAQNVERILGSNFIGCYLFGSLAVGDFDPATSDVDILVVSHHNLNPFEVEQLSDFHKTLFQSKTAFSTELECFYASKNELQNFAQGKSICFKVDRGSGGLAFATAELNKIVSKKEAAKFALTIPDERWKQLIQKALNRDASGSVSETQGFIRFTREKLTN